MAACELRGSGRSSNLHTRDQLSLSFSLQKNLVQMMSLPSR